MILPDLVLALRDRLIEVLHSVSCVFLITVRLILLLHVRSRSVLWRKLGLGTLPRSQIIRRL